MSRKDSPSETPHAPADDAREAVGFLRAALSALFSFWPRRGEVVKAPASRIETPGDPGPVLEELERAKARREPPKPSRHVVSD